MCKDGCKLAKDGVDHVSCVGEKWVIPQCVEDSVVPEDPTDTSKICGFIISL